MTKISFRKFLCAGEDLHLHVLADTNTSSWLGYCYNTRAYWKYIKIKNLFPACNSYAVALRAGAISSTASNVSS